MTILTAAMEKIKEVVTTIVERKRCQRIVPAIATALEVQSELIKLGHALTPDLWRGMIMKLESDPQIEVRRLLRYNGYRLIDHADDAKANAQSVSASAKGA